MDMMEGLNGTSLLPIERLRVRNMSQSWATLETFEPVTEGLSNLSQSWATLETFEPVTEGLSNISQSWATLETFEYVTEGILIMFFTMVGIVGNLASLYIFSTQATHRVFHNLLVALSIFDMIYLVCAVQLFSIRALNKEATEVYYIVILPYALPLASMGMIGSIYCTVAISLERYLAVAHPFTRYRNKYKSRHFIVPVVLYTLLYNLPKFFELNSMCCSLENPGNCTSTPHHGYTEDGLIIDMGGVCGARAALKIIPTKLRKNYWYVNIYVLWMNNIFNILLPLTILILLNILIARKIQEHMKNLEPMARTSSKSGNGLQREKTFRRREATLSKISLYIVVILVFCHAQRIVPTLWEMVQTYKADYSHKKVIDWPDWVEAWTQVSHLLLTVSCSLNFYVYYGKHGRPYQRMRKKMSRTKDHSTVTGLHNFSTEVKMVDGRSFRSSINSYRRSNSYRMSSIDSYRRSNSYNRRNSVISGCSANNTIVTTINNDTDQSFV